MPREEYPELGPSRWEGGGIKVRRGGVGMLLSYMSAILFCNTHLSVSWKMVRANKKAAMGPQNIGTTHHFVLVRLYYHQLKIQRKDRAISPLGYPTGTSSRILSDAGDYALERGNTLSSMGPARLGLREVLRGPRIYSG
jgi:hypothetical protein